MVFVKVLGVIDLIAMAVMLLIHYGISLPTLGLVFGLYFILKGFVFGLHYLVNILDIIIGLYIIFMMITHIHFIITFVFAIHILIKSMQSLYM